MKLTRICTGSDNQSHFEELDLPLRPSGRRATSDPITTLGVGFSASDPLAPLDWHHAPRRQIVAVLSGAFEIEVGDGSKRHFGPGDAFLADDLAGQGHLTRDVGGPMRLLYIYLPDDFDPAPWRTG